MIKNFSCTITHFTEHVLQKPLYPYQQEIAEAIIASIIHKRGHIFTIMMARQSGKNQLSAILEAFLLYSMPEGTIVKAAPTSTPQIMHSRLRLLSMLDTPALRKRVWSSDSHVIGLAPEADPALLRARAGPRVMFFSAAPESNVVGATADLLLEIDEAQDVSSEKFDRDFRPMAATTAATTILYGTAWSDTTLLAQQRVLNLEQQQRTGERRHFEYDWHALAAINPAYRMFVEGEIARLGEEHPAIQTQYMLRTVQGTDRFFNALQRTLLEGAHSWEDTPREGGWYIAGMDVAGEERDVASVTHAAGKRDSTVMTIGRVTYNDLNLPCIEIVHHEWWTGLAHIDQYAATVALVERWSIRALAIDATGLGAGLASLLHTRLGEERIIPFTFTRPSKSRLAFQLLALLNSGRLKLYSAQSGPSRLVEECMWQLREVRCRLPAPNTLDFYIDPAHGHDDFVCSLALLTEALPALTLPAVSVWVKSMSLYSAEGRF